jgi:hypothetical protein
MARWRVLGNGEPLQELFLPPLCRVKPRGRAARGCAVVPGHVVILG